MVNYNGMKNSNIYFAASISGGREDVQIYSEIINYLKNYGNVLTEMIGDKNLGEMGESLDDIFIHDFNLKTVPAGTTWMETQAGATVGTIYLRRGFVPVGAIRTIGPGTINQHDVINSLTEVKGRATLVAGTVTVNNANAAAARDIEAFAIDNNTTGALRISAVVDGVSFTITSSNLLDTGVVAWEIKEP